MQDETTPNDGNPAEGEMPATTGTPEAIDPQTQLMSLMEQLSAAEAKAAENWERCLRATAEQDNIRKRAEREIDAARRFALEKFAQDLLGVWDSLELGLKAARDAGASDSHVEGTEITLKMLSDVMGRHGVKAIDPHGETFDPEKHEAMSAVPMADAAPNTVIDVLQKGYALNERVLRPAMVVVARAPA